MKEIVAKKLGSELFSYLNKIIEIADKKGYPIFLVGGIVRDIILERDNLDLDLVVEGDGISVAKEASKILGGKLTIHERFGTAVIALPNHKIDIASARSETYEHSGALPKVELSSIKEDLKRRDFTINSMAVRLNRENPYTLLDPFNGENDLKEKRLEVLHDNSFIDDPTRMLRGIRFEQRFKFNFSENTTKLFGEAIGEDRLNNISPIRFYNEFNLICQEKDPYSPIGRMGGIGFFRYIDKAITYGEETQTIFNQIKWTMPLLENKEEIDMPLLFLTALIAPLPEENILEVCQKFSVAENDRTDIIHGKRNEAATIATLSQDSDMENSAIYRLLSPLAKEYLIYITSKVIDERVEENIVLYLSELSEVKIELSGDDIISLGIKEGKAVGDILSLLKDERLNGRIDSQEGELAFVRNKLLKIK